MTAPAFTDVEGALRTWEKTHPLLVPVVAGRVFFGYPDGSPALPLLTLSRAGGAPQRGEAPLEDVRISHSVWGSNKKMAIDGVKALTSALHSLSNVVLDEFTYAYSAEVTNVLWLPDQEAKLARYVCDAIVTVRARN